MNYEIAIRYQLARLFVDQGRWPVSVHAACDGPVVDPERVVAFNNDDEDILCDAHALLEALMVLPHAPIDPWAFMCAYRVRHDT